MSPTLTQQQRLTCPTGCTSCGSLQQCALPLLPADCRQAHSGAHVVELVSRGWLEGHLQHRSQCRRITICRQALLAACLQIPPESHAMLRAGVEALDNQ